MELHLPVDESNSKLKENLMQELKAMKSLSRHANIVQLLSYCIEKGTAVLSLHSPTPLMGYWC